MSHKPRISGYSFGKQLGKGSFGEVYLIVNQKTGQKFACKAIPKAKLDQSGTKLIRQEISPLNKLSHPNLVSIYALYETDDYFCFVMDLCEQGSLQTYLNVHGAINNEDIVREIAIQLLKALEYIHLQGVAHRDLKPSNILITSFPSVKISDFGLSGVSAESGLMNTACGTFYFSAPECFSPPYNGFAADVWSLGIVFYILYFGTMPWREKSFLKIKLEKEKGLQNIPDSPPLFIAFLKEMIQPDVAIRGTASSLLKHPWIINNNKISPNIDNQLKDFSKQNLKINNNENSSKIDSPSKLMKSEITQSQDQIFSHSIQKSDKSKNSSFGEKRQLSNPSLDSRDQNHGFKPRQAKLNFL